MKLGRWSQTAASNNTTPPDGWPEGQAPSTVNDCAREMMASIRAAFSDLQFFDQDFTPTYVSATSFTVPGDQTSAIHAGRRLKIYDATAGVATTIYATVATASFTTVTTVSVSCDAGQLTSSLSSFAIAILSKTNQSLPVGLGNQGADRFSASAIETTTLTASGAVVLKSTLSVSGQAGFASLQTTGNPVFGRGATDAQITLAGSSVTTASGVALLVRSTSPTRLELVRGDAAVAYDMLLANMELGGTLTVGGATVLKGALSVGGVATLANTLVINGGTASAAGSTMLLAWDTVSGGSVQTYSGLPLRLNPLSNAVHVGPSGLQVGGATTLASTLSVSGAAVLTGTLSVSAQAVSGTYIKTGAVTVASLPAAATVGSGGRYMVTDASSLTFGASASGGGANIAPVWSNGTSWLIG